jgi:proteasome lid subunit RPN8/RPN11
MKISISKSLVEQIENHARIAYPEECCGFLLGTGENNRRTILKIEPANNINKDLRTMRYEIAPNDIIKMEKQAQENNLWLLGFYHSHPDHPAKPSRYDSEGAWPWYTYLILSVKQGMPKTMRAWNFNIDKHLFEEEKLIVIQQTV